MVATPSVGANPAQRVHVAKAGLEKYFMCKMKSGYSELSSERIFLKCMGITRVKSEE